MFFKGTNKEFKQFLEQLKKKYGSNITLKEIIEREKTKC